MLSKSGETAHRSNLNSSQFYLGILVNACTLNGVKFGIVFSVLHLSPQCSNSRPCQSRLLIT